MSDKTKYGDPKSAQAGVGHLPAKERANKREERAKRRKNAEEKAKRKAAPSRRPAPLSK